MSTDGQTKSHTLYIQNYIHTRIVKEMNMEKIVLLSFPKLHYEEERELRLSCEEHHLPEASKKMGASMESDRSYSKFVAAVADSDLHYDGDNSATITPDPTKEESPFGVSDKNESASVTQKGSAMWTRSRNRVKKNPIESPKVIKNDLKKTESSLLLIDRQLASDQRGYRSRRIDYLLRHMRSHTGNPTLPCDLCKYRTRFPSYLKLHKMIHTGAKPFGCALCDYRTNNKNKLVPHLRRHYGWRPFKCKKCNWRFIEKADVKIHMRVHSKKMKNPDMSGVRHVRSFDELQKHKAKLDKAVKAVQNEKLPMKTSAKLHGVPYATLYYRIFPKRLNQGGKKTSTTSENDSTKQDHSSKKLLPLKLNPAVIIFSKMKTRASSASMDLHTHDHTRDNVVNSPRKFVGLNQGGKKTSKPSEKGSRKQDHSSNKLLPLELSPPPIIFSKMKTRASSASMDLHTHDHTRDNVVNSPRKFVGLNQGGKKTSKPSEKGSRKQDHSSNKLLPLELSPPPIIFSKMKTRASSASMDLHTHDLTQDNVVNSPRKFVGLNQGVKKTSKPSENGSKKQDHSSNKLLPLELNRPRIIFSKMKTRSASMDNSPRKFFGNTKGDQKNSKTPRHYSKKQDHSTKKLRSLKLNPPPKISSRLNQGGKKTSKPSENASTKRDHSSKKLLPLKLNPPPKIFSKMKTRSASMDSTRHNGVANSLMTFVGECDIRAAAAKLPEARVLLHNVLSDQFRLTKWGKENIRPIRLRLPDDMTENSPEMKTRASSASMDLHTHDPTQDNVVNSPRKFVGMKQGGKKTSKPSENGSTKQDHSSNKLLPLELSPPPIIFSKMKTRASSASMDLHTHDLTRDNVVNSPRKFVGNTKGDQKNSKTPRHYSKKQDHSTKKLRSLKLNPPPKISSRLNQGGKKTSKPSENASTKRDHSSKKLLPLKLNPPPKIFSKMKTRSASMDSTRHNGVANSLMTFVDDERKGGQQTDPKPILTPTSRILVNSSLRCAICGFWSRELDVLKNHVMSVHIM